MDLNNAIYPQQKVQRIPPFNPLIQIKSGGIRFQSNPWPDLEESGRRYNYIMYIYIYTLYNFACCLYVCDTWSLTLREEPRMRVFENRVFRRIFRLKRDEVTGECRKLNNEELNDLYRSPKIVRVIK